MTHALFERSSCQRQAGRVKATKKALGSDAKGFLLEV